MELARNAVYAMVVCGKVKFFHLNKNGFINPFWIENKGFSIHGELRNHPEGIHEHWQNSINENIKKIVMVQSHVTKASQVDFKRCRKFARNVK